MNTTGEAQPAQTLCITGAGRGIGLELTAQALAQGRRVIATVRSPGKADALQALADADDRLQIRRLDVLDDASLAAFRDSLSTETLDLLVANSGVYEGRGGMNDLSMTKTAFEVTLMTNVFGPFATVRAAAPALARGQAPRVAILGSRMGSNAEALGKGSGYAYRASKAAATNLARCLVGELSPLGVAIGVFHPGWVRTDMGGAEADIDVATSAAGLLARFDALSLSTTGVFEDYQGAALPL